VGPRDASFIPDVETSEHHHLGHPVEITSFASTLLAERRRRPRYSRRQMSTSARKDRVTRRAFLVGAGIVVGAAVASTLVERVARHGPPALKASGRPPYGIDNWPGLDWHLFSETSPWVAPIDKGNVDPRSDIYISSLVSAGPPGSAGPRQLFGWGFPLYFGQVSDPVYRIVLRDTSFTYGQHLDGHQIHAPSGMQPSYLSDAVIYAIDQVDGYTYRFRETTVDDTAKTITALHAFRLETYGSGYNTIEEPPTGMLPIRPEELAAGYVNHTVGLHADCLSGHSVAPYEDSGTKGVQCSPTDATTRLSMGNVVFLDLTHDQIDALTIPTWQKAICKGLADHGALVGFNGSSSWTLTFEAPQDRIALGKGNPYAELGLPETLDYSVALDEIGGWGAHLKVLAPFPRPA
jgi:hypothetical protein